MPGSKFIPFFFLLTVVTSENVNIAVIGGGIGGASTAHFLRLLFGDETSIDLYEKGEVGGRLATVKIGGFEYESGGAIIHPANLYMVKFTDMLGLNKSEDGPKDWLGIFDGKQMVFEGSTNDIVTALKFLYHYGWDIFTINSYVKQLLHNFSRIYDHQNDGYSFTSVENLLNSMSPVFVQMLSESISSNMKSTGLSDAFIDQLVRSAMRTNYGQDIDIGAFVGSVSMAGIEPGLWSVFGGNKLVPQKLVEYSDINLINSRVVEVILKSPGNSEKYEVITENWQIWRKTYDIVVIATPLHDQLTNIKFTGFPKPIQDFPEHYLQRFATFVKGLPNPRYFGFNNVTDVPTTIFTCNKNLKISSVARHVPVNYSPAMYNDLVKQTPVYKVFTNKRLGERELQEIFEWYEEVEVVDWIGAYPVYTPYKSSPPFELFKRLYYVNGIEIASSAMEMSALAGRNVALLAHAQWNGDFSRIDSLDVMSDTITRKASDEL